MKKEFGQGRRLTVAQWLWSGFGVVILVLLLIGAVIHFTVQGITTGSQAVVTDLSVDAELAQREIDHLVWVSRVRDYLAAEGGGELRVETDYRQCGFGRWYYGEGRRQLETLMPNLAPLLARIEQPHQELHRSAVQLAAADGPQQAAIYAQQTVPALAGTQGLLQEIRQKLRQEVEVRQEVLTGDARSRSRLISLAVVLAVAVAMVIAWGTSRLISRMVRDISNRMNSCSSEVSSSASQVAAGGQQLAEGASEQAASIEEISSTVEEISSMTRKNADNASQADSLMRETIGVVRRAGDSMNQLTAAMRTITSSSEETQKIVKTIDEIAFQTNLLALNAAVEAARAGEAGAGFAVVADEVRNLAMRAAEAARNTAAMIESTVNDIRQGSRLVEETDHAFGEVNTSTGKASSLVGEIAAASGEQAKGIEQFGRAMGEMESVVQQTAANAEESAASAEQLSAMSAQMQDVVADLMALVEKK